MEGKSILIIFTILVCAIALFLGMQDDEVKKSEPKPKEEKTEETYQYEEAAVKTAASSSPSYTDKELEEVKKVATDFVKSFHNFDASKPLQGIENSKKYMSEELYLFHAKNPPRGTLAAVKQKYTNVRLDDTSETKEKVMCNIFVTSEATDNDGKTHTEEFLYLVQLEKENGKFIVSGVNIDATY